MFIVKPSINIWSDEKDFHEGMKMNSLCLFPGVGDFQKLNLSDTKLISASCLYPQTDSTPLSKVGDYEKGTC